MILAAFIGAGLVFGLAVTLIFPLGGVGLMFLSVIGFGIATASFPKRQAARYVSRNKSLEAALSKLGTNEYRRTARTKERWSFSQALGCFSAGAFVGFFLAVWGASLPPFTEKGAGL